MKFKCPDFKRKLLLNFVLFSCCWDLFYLGESAVKYLILGISPVKQFELLKLKVHTSGYI